MKRKPTRALTCQRGHPRNEQTTYLHEKDGAYRQICRICRAMSETARRHGLSLFNRHHEQAVLKLYNGRTRLGRKDTKRLPELLRS